MEKKLLPPTITIPTNYNNKLGCERFIHIQVAPKHGIPESVANSTEIIIYTADQSHPPVTVKIYDAARVPFKHLPESWITLSHAMTTEQFHNMVLENVPGIGPETSMAIFFYQKIHQQ